MVTPARVLAAATMVVGVAMAARPDAVARAVAGLDHPPPPPVVRVLGVRELVQGIAVAARPTRTVIGLGVLVDLSHAVTMVAATRVFPQYRRSAVASAVLAVGSGVAGMLLLPRRPG